MNENLRDKYLIFVFGSNLAGRHGKGAAEIARHCFEAQYGVGEGLTGRSYALPTKDARLRSLTLKDIQAHVERFIKFARENPELTFIVTAIGCGLAAHDPKDIGPLFRAAPENVFVSPRFIG
jgi:hypothetical protein